ncbi:MAG TPA: hypothetical protein PKI03_00510 [Pseudomonadota bacterium]|nr:hypothetical protein [Pseudomonadota bacterium]
MHRFVDLDGVFLRLVPSELRFNQLLVTSIKRRQDFGTSLFGDLGPLGWIGDSGEDLADLLLVTVAEESSALGLTQSLHRGVHFIASQRRLRLFELLLPQVLADVCIQVVTGKVIGVGLADLGDLLRALAP